MVWGREVRKDDLFSIVYVLRRDGFDRGPWKDWFEEETRDQGDDVVDDDDGKKTMESGMADIAVHARVRVLDAA
jgi:hypothetical protein